ncbi:MAG: 50S ribosomal protein L23 [Deltaproteobacteria bacterium]|nr:50S ribosomal protein L23 [Deltaproteobacteria bacterium]
MRLEDVIQRPLVTEKAARQMEKVNEYFFAVHPAADKHLIRLAVEYFFGVHVVAVRTMNVEGKLKRFGRHMGRGPDWKKAVVRLKEKETIKIFEGQ